MQNTFVEKGPLFAPEKVTLQSIQKRFGEDTLTTQPGIEKLTTVVALSNSIVTESNIPDRSDHFASWRITRLSEESGHGFAVSLHDLILTRSLIPENAQRYLLAEKLRLEMDEYRNEGGLNEKTKLLSQIKAEVEHIPEIEMQIFSEVADFIPDSFGHSIKISNGSGGFLELNVFDEPWFSVDIPVNVNFDRNVAIYAKALKAISVGLELDYPPSLEYRFMFSEDSKVEDSAISSSVNYAEYLNKCLKNWAMLKVNQIRAIANVGKDGSVVLLTEDSTLNELRIKMLDNFVKSNTAKVGDGQDFDLAPIADDHEIIFSSFESALLKGIVNTEMTDQFPEGDFSGWLHLFINIDQNGVATLEKDLRSGLEEERFREMLPQIEIQYGLKYGREMTEKESLHNASMAMFMPRIEKEVAQMESKIDRNTANKFRKYAISGLVYGSQHALERYEEFLKLIK